MTPFVLELTESSLLVMAKEMLSKKYIAVEGFFGLQLIMTIPPLMYGLLLFATGYNTLLKLDKELDNHDTD